MTEPIGKRAVDFKSRIGITIGDPAGIGPEVSLKAGLDPSVLARCIPVLIGDAAYLKKTAVEAGLSRDFAVVHPGEAIPPDAAGPVIYDLANLSQTIEFGKEQAAAGRAAAEYIETAVRLWQAGMIDAITTAPINKKSLSLAGYSYPGHTEFLAHLTHTDEFAMTFFSERLRVSLLTTHVALADVPGYVKREPLEKLIRLLQREFLRFGFARPRIAVAALNPHGGEGMLFGKEEGLEMTPAIESCRRIDGIDVSGPHSGDTIFVRAARGEFDVVISCYHDQGLIPVKCFSFGEAVNVTLGLPLIRTSVDHGTAFDIAGRNMADPSSMAGAIRLAVELHQRQNANENRSK
jgi:4-hydroxythreonine-4-phosphate dehydrogenase